MPRLMMISSCAGCFVLMSGAIAWAQDIDMALRDQFLRGVRQSYKMVEEISVHVQCVTTQDFANPSGAARVEVSNAGIDPERKEVVESFRIAIRGSLRLKAGIDRKKCEYVIAQNDKYAFRINRAPLAKGYSLELLEQPGAAPDVDNYIQNEQMKARLYVPGTFGMHGHLLSELIDSPFFKMKRISKHQSDGNELVRIEFDYLIDEPDKKKERLSEAFMICDPARGWALKEYGGTLWSGALYRVTLDFGDLVNSFPIAKEVAIFYSLPSVSKVTRRTVTTIEVLSQDVPKEQFYLSHYGLPEPNFRRGWMGTWVWYLAAGIVCLSVAAIIAKRRSARLA